MRRLLVILAFCLTAIPLAGCAEMNLKNPFTSDPLTGGIDAGTSRLLGLSVPPGMQLYPSHGLNAPDGGMEVFRGRADMASVAQYMHSGLQGQGWNLRLARRKDGRAVYLYERGSSVAALTLEKSAFGSLLYIWTGERLPDGAALPQDALPPAGSGSDGYGASGGMDTTPQPGAVETWGDTGTVQERNL